MSEVGTPTRDRITLGGPIADGEWITTHAGSVAGEAAPPTPGVREAFFDRLRSFGDRDQLANPILAELFPAEDFVRFALHHGVGTGAARDLLRGGSYEAMIRSGLLQRFRDWLAGFERTEPSREISFAIPLCELHAPNVPGAKTVYTILRSHEDEASLAVTVAGFGAGGAVTRKVQCELEVELDPGRCLGLVADADALVSRWENVFTGKLLDVVSVTGLSGFAYPVPIEDLPYFKPEDHVCLHDDAFAAFQQKIRSLGLVRGKDYHTASPKHDATLGITIERSDTYSASWSVSDGVGDGVGVEIKSRFVESAKGEFTLRSGYAYIAAFRGVDLLPVTWSAQRFV